MDLSAFQFQKHEPYPSTQIACRNECYAHAMMSNVGACNSEMSAVSLYFYNSVILQDSYPEVAQIFHKISVVEMRHLHIFATLAHKLGADPRLMSYEEDELIYWSPSCNHYPRPLLPLLQNALQGEKDAIRAYRSQLCWISDPCICANLKRIIQDEELHVQIYEALCRYFSNCQS